MSNTTNISEYRSQGNSHFSKKEFDKAIEFYTQAIEQDDNDKLSYSNRSVSYLNIGKYNDALNDSMKIIKIDVISLKTTKNNYLLLMI